MVSFLSEGIFRVLDSDAATIRALQHSSLQIVALVEGSCHIRRYGCNAKHYNTALSGKPKLIAVHTDIAWHLRTSTDM